MNTDAEKREVTIESPEIQGIISELLERSETIKKRDEMTKESFREWFCHVIVVVADKMGYYIRNLVVDIPLDMLYSFRKGFSTGLKRAKESSCRYKDSHKEE